MFSKSPHSAWHSDDLDAKIGPLWGEKDEAKRIAGWKAVDRYIAEQGYVLPLLQYVAADPLQVRSQGDPERFGRLAASNAGLEGLVPNVEAVRRRAGRGGHRRHKFEDR